MKPVAAEVLDCFSWYQGFGPRVWSSIGRKAGPVWERFYSPKRDVRSVTAELQAAVGTDIRRRLGK